MYHGAIAAQLAPALAGAFLPATTGLELDVTILPMSWGQLQIFHPFNGDIDIQCHPTAYIHCDAYPTVRMQPDEFPVCGKYRVCDHR